MKSRCSTLLSGLQPLGTNPLRDLNRRGLINVDPLNSRADTPIIINARVKICLSCCYSSVNFNTADVRARRWQRRFEYSDTALFYVVLVSRWLAIDGNGESIKDIRVHSINDSHSELLGGASLNRECNFRFCIWASPAEIFLVCRRELSALPIGARNDLVEFEINA